MTKPPVHPNLDLTNTNAIPVATIITSECAQIPNGLEVALLLASFPSQDPMKTGTVRLVCPSNMVGKPAERGPSFWSRLSEACSN